MSLRHNAYSSYSSDSDEEEEWSASHKKSKKKQKVPSKRPRIEPKCNNILEEGEVSSDDLDDDDDDGLDENLIGGDEDKRMLEKMSEREREEELFKRGERREAMRARRVVKRKLREKKERERAEKSGFHVSKSNKDASDDEESGTKRHSAYADVFTSDSDEGQNSESSLSGEMSGIKSRKQALERRKEETSSRFQKLIESRRQKQQRKIGGSDKHGDRDQALSDSDSDSDSSDLASRHSGSSVIRETASKLTRSDHNKSGSKRPSSSDESAYSDASRGSRRGRKMKQRERSSCSSSLSGSSDESDERSRARGRSRSPEEELISNMNQMSKIRISRFKIERLVHMPFFDELMKGCFVRLNIGLSHGVPIYRCAQIVDIIEGTKIYELGNTRTNKCCIVRIGNDQSSFRLAYVSNAQFLQSEFDSWIRRTAEAGVKLPSLTFVEQKANELQNTLQNGISDDKTIEQIIQSKRRFQKAPTNFALRKAELLKDRELAETGGDRDLLRRIDSELEELESQADRIDRRRTMGFKSITTINQRNRALSVQQAEAAIMEEAEAVKRKAAAGLIEEDFFARTKSKPVIVTKRFLEALKSKRTQGGDNVSKVSNEDGSANENNGDSSQKPDNSIRRPDPDGFVVPPLPGLSRGQRHFESELNGMKASESEPGDLLHAIHNFDIHIDIDLGAGSLNRCASANSLSNGVVNGTCPGVSLPLGVNNVSGGMVTSASTSYLPNMIGSVNQGSGILMNNVLKPAQRRMLNLAEYKKRKGLI